MRQRSSTVCGVGSFHVESSNGPHGASTKYDHLEKGPKLNNNLLKMFVNFPVAKIGITSGIQKAFLQIFVKKVDRNALRFLWLVDTSETGEMMPPIKEISITRVPFVSTGNLFLLNATLLHHFGNMKGTYQETATLLQKIIYVDNLVTGAATLEETKKLSRSH